MSTAKITTDHGEIRKWVEDRGGKPSTVQRTASPEAPGILRIDFPGPSEADSLATISWEEFFRKFEDEKLAFLHQDRLASGELSRFNKFVSRDRPEPGPRLVKAPFDANKVTRASLRRSGRRRRQPTSKD